MIECYDEVYKGLLAPRGTPAGARARDAGHKHVNHG
jgi:hypothetical protein